MARKASQGDAGPSQVIKRTRKEVPYTARAASTWDERKHGILGIAVLVRPLTENRTQKEEHQFWKARF